MKGIVFSKKDPAGLNMFDSFKDMGFKPNQEHFNNNAVFQKDDLVLVPIEPDIVYPAELDLLAEKFDLEYIVMASRHKSKSGKPALTCHATGNYGKAEFGGNPAELQYTIANPMRNIFLELVDCPLEYEVTLEATHHGPTKFKVPLFFVELGSSEKEWADTEAAAFVANSIVNGCNSKDKTEVGIGFGGGHYMPKCTPLMEEVAFGHTCAKYAFEELTEGLIRQMVEKTVDGVDLAVIDSKIKGHHKVMIKSALDNLEVEY